MVYVEHEMTSRKTVRAYIDEFVDQRRTSGHPRLHEFAKEAESLGYVRVALPLQSFSDLCKLRDLAQLKLGYDNYNWLGRTFWFNNEQDATWFRLLAE